MNKIAIKKMIAILQYCVFLLAKSFYRKKSLDQVSMVIASQEVAKMLYMLNKALKNSVSVCLTQNFYYSLEYDYYCKSKSKIIAFIYKLFYGPILFAKLTKISDVFIYLWSDGFFLDREREFKYLKAKQKKIVCIFMGDDIRSPKKMLEFYKENSVDGFIEYFGQSNLNYLSEYYDEEKKYIAKIADTYADVIFSCPVDMKSYLRSKQYFFPFLYESNLFFKNQDKFEKNVKIKILHAPSNPLVKGTPLVRAAIKKLEIEGYDFEYIELQKMSNQVVLEHLKTAHIVLNQFYTYVPGIFGIEAMAHHCAVLMSADSSIEIDMPCDSKDAWMITKYWEVYDNLKYLLDHKEKIKHYADKGYEFAYNHYTYEAASEYIKKIFKENGIQV